MTKNRLATDSDFAQPLAEPLKIGVVGCTGRVGRLLAREILAREDGLYRLAGGTVKPEDMPEDSDIGTVLDELPLDIPVFSEPQNLFDVSDLIIDFTAPEATARHVWIAAKTRKPIVIGTTGLSREQEQEIKDAALECPVLYAANMSIGVTLLMALVKQTATRLAEDWDIEITETHHKYKVDAPSGTAIALGKAAATGRDENIDDKAVYSREGHTGRRRQGDIGFSVQRGGDVVGEHTVTFFGEGERIELTHRATNRALFVLGALRGAVWLRNQKPGLYNMKHVLDL